MRLISLGLLGVSLLGAAPVESGSVDLALAKLARKDPARIVRALVRKPSGEIVVEQGTAAALASRPHAELARRVRPRGDIAGASTVAFRGTISSGTDVDTYTFAALAGQSVRVRVHPEGSLNPFLSVTDAAPVTDDNSGPGSAAQLDVTWTSAGAKPIAVSSVGGTTGAYLLMITATTAIAPGVLTGGDIGASTPHVAGTRAREARSVEAVDGTGVLIGFVDSGIDFAHADFRYPGGATRLVGIWDQTLTAVAGERVPAAGYGVHYKEDEINTAGFVRQTDTIGHGSLVASVAAGDDPVFPGAAPNARLMMVKFDETTTGLVGGVNFILAEAERLEFDAVVINLSVGTHDGPHDGTSLLDQAINGAVARARHVVCAAGNESNPLTAVIHARSTISSTTTWTYLPSALAPAGEPHAIDIWCHGSDTYTVTVTNLTGSTTATAVSGTTATAGPTTGATLLTIDNRVDAPSNGATHIRVEIQDLVLAQPWSITLTRNASSTGTGVADGYIATEDGTFLAGFDIALNPDGSVPGCIVEPATSQAAIAAGAYRGRFMWDTATGTTVKSDGTGSGIAGDLALFSSRGPTRDGRQKPDIAAPGAYVAGARSASSTPAAADVDADAVHVYGSGTSFAAPHVAGIVALVLQKNRLQTNDEMKATLASTALADGFTVPGNAWGAGKVNATTLLAAVFAQRDVRARAGGCGAGAGASATPLLCLLAALLLWRLR